MLHSDFLLEKFFVKKEQHLSVSEHNTDGLGPIQLGTKNGSLYNSKLATQRPSENLYHPLDFFYLRAYSATSVSYIALEAFKEIFDVNPFGT